MAEPIELAGVGKCSIQRYSHGGCRVWREEEDGTRDLVLDLYEPSERREMILEVLAAPRATPHPEASRLAERVAALEADAHEAFMLLPVTPGDSMAWAGLIAPHARWVADEYAIQKEQIRAGERRIASLEAQQAALLEYVDRPCLAGCEECGAIARVEVRSTDDGAARLCDDCAGATPQPEVPEIADYIRGAWNSAHAHLDVVRSCCARSAYQGRIDALERLAERLGFDISPVPRAEGSESATPGGT